MVKKARHEHSFELLECQICNFDPVKMNISQLLSFFTSICYINDLNTFEEVWGRKLVWRSKNRPETQTLSIWINFYHKMQPVIPKGWANGCLWCSNMQFKPIPSCNFILEFHDETPLNDKNFQSDNFSFKLSWQVNFSGRVRYRSQVSRFWTLHWKNKGF